MNFQHELNGQDGHEKIKMISMGGQKNVKFIVKVTVFGQDLVACETFDIDEADETYNAILEAYKLEK